MEWHKTYNSALWSPQILALSDAGFRCWMLMRGYASQHETDGFIPSAAGMLFDPDGFAEVTGTELVERAITGWIIRGWLEEERQTSAEQVQTDRAAARDRMQRRRQRRPAASPDVRPEHTPEVTPGVRQLEVEVEVEVEEELEVERAAGLSPSISQDADSYGPAARKASSA